MSEHLCNRCDAEYLDYTNGLCPTCSDSASLVAAVNRIGRLIAELPGLVDDVVLDMFFACDRGDAEYEVLRGEILGRMKGEMDVD